MITARGRRSFAPFASVAAPTFRFPPVASSERPVHPGPACSAVSTALTSSAAAALSALPRPTAAVVSYFSPALRSMRPLLLPCKEMTVRARSKSKDSGEATFNKARITQSIRDFFGPFVATPAATANTFYMRIEKDHGRLEHRPCQSFNQPDCRHDPAQRPDLSARVSRCGARPLQGGLRLNGAGEHSNAQLSHG